MAVQTLNFTTGPATLPDVGTFSYNGCTFSPLFATSISGSAVKDAAQRTVKYVEHTITVDGYVTAPNIAVLTGVSNTVRTLHTLLTAQGGALVYQGRGFDLNINPAGGRAGGAQDVAWGPVPELIEFQPLGGGLSAKVKWQVKVRIPWATAGSKANGVKVMQGGVNVPLLQFNFDTVVSYAEDGYSTLTMKGTMEIPLTRNQTQTTRSLPYTVDDFRSTIQARVMSGIDLSRFRVTRRDFPVSRDKRTLEWSVVAEERPYMDLPPNCTIARGSYSVRPAKAGMGLCLWLCTLRATYTLRADSPRRNAWFAFLALLHLRMSQSKLGNVPALGGGEQNPKKRGNPLNDPRTWVSPFGPLNPAFWLGYFSARNKQEEKDTRKAFLIDFSFDEGLYLDSKTVTFSASWRLVTTFSNILLASGIWAKVPEKDGQNNNLWATSMRDVQGVKSWLVNRLDNKLDVVVDFGGG